MPKSINTPKLMATRELLAIYKIANAQFMLQRPRTVIKLVEVFKVVFAIMTSRTFIDLHHFLFICFDDVLTIEAAYMSHQRVLK